MLEIKDLSVKGKNEYSILENISFKIEQGECIGITGASGSGKTSLIKVIMGLQDTTCKKIKGEIYLDGRPISEISQKEKRQLCGKTFGFIPQNPMGAFHKHKKIGRHMAETFRYHLGLSKEKSNELAKNVLEKVNLDADRVLKLYPEQLSGGMLQRITIAISLGLQQDYIFADEPTAALDDGNKKIIINLFKERYKQAGIVFLSHDVEALKSLCNEILVMENGKIAERNSTELVFKKPQSEWMKKLVHSIVESGEEDWKWTALR